MARWQACVSANTLVYSASASAYEHFASTRSSESESFPIRIYHQLFLSLCHGSLNVIYIAIKARTLKERICEKWKLFQCNPLVILKSSASTLIALFMHRSAAASRKNRTFWIIQIIQATSNCNKSVELFCLHNACTVTPCSCVFSFAFLAINVH